MITPDDLRAVSVFEGLEPEALAWLAGCFEEVRLAEGERLHEPGAPAEWLYVTLQGHLAAVVEEGGREVGTFTFEEGEVGGMLPRSRMTHFPALTRATEPSRVARLHVRHFPEMLRRLPVLEARLMHLMADRIREGARARIQQEKLVSLGTMAAGLAHELNNPATAARRSAERLCETLQVFDELASRLLREALFEQLDDGADPFQPLYATLARGAEAVDPVTQGEREDDLADWLDAVGVPEPWEAAAALVAGGFTRAELERFAGRLRAEHVGAFVAWLARDVEMRQLCDELARSTERISGLVTAMKSYSYMDRAAEKRPTDLHRGLDDTLVILQHKLRAKAVRVERSYAEDLPPVDAYGGELNQVWTNLLDNAVAAVGDGGRIEIRTRYDAPAAMAQVDVIDDGAGIPPEIQARVFEPFFTTKGPGEGTGLGLDAAYRIVTRRHRGTIWVASEPGETHFRVRLPLHS